MTARQPRVTGCREERSGGTYVVLERDFAAPIDSVWAAVTEPERIAVDRHLEWRSSQRHRGLSDDRRG